MDMLLRLLSGDLDATERIWSALGPGIVLVAYVLFGLLVYLVRLWRVGPYRDPELEARPRTVLTALWLRLYFAWLMRPVWYVVFRSGIPATALTTLSVLLSVASAVALAMGRFSLGGWLFIAGGICDFLDGRVARERGRASSAGSFLDSVLDRYSDGVVLVGLAWFYRHDWVLLVVLATMLGSQITSYVRAKGESLGVQIHVGLMQRAERLLLLGIGVALSPIVEAIVDPHNPRPDHRLAIAALVLLAISTQTTAARRFIYGLRALDHRPFLGFGTLSRGSLARNVIAALVATAVDFAVFSALVTRVFVDPGVATAAGCAVGAVVNFTVNRTWVFGSRSSATKQGMRYAFVSVTSALLNAGGVMVLLLVPSAEVYLAWLAVRGAVYLAWNFPLQRDYVFGDAIERPADDDAALAPARAV